MSHKQSDRTVLLGPEDLWMKLEQLALATIGVPAQEFIDGHRTGRFDHLPIAHDLAALLPFVRRPG